MENKKIQIFNETIYYIEENSNKPKVLFLHGFNSSSNFAHQLYKLKNRDYDVVAFDFPGCGLSTSNSEITIQYYQKIALEFVNKINYKFDLVVAHSLGGASALYLLNNKIVKKALLAAPINYNLLSTFANETIEQGIKRIARWLVPKNYNDALESSDNLIYGNKLNYRKNITQKANAFLKLMEHKWIIFDKLVSKEILNPRYHKKIIKDLYAANNDYSFITGTMDKFVPFLSVAKIANEYNKDLIGIKDCGHAIFFEKPIEVNDRINSLIDDIKYGL